MVLTKFLRSKVQQVRAHGAQPELRAYELLFLLASVPAADARRAFQLRTMRDLRQTLCLAAAVRRLCWQKTLLALWLRSHHCQRGRLDSSRGLLRLRSRLRVTKAGRCPAWLNLRLSLPRRKLR